MATAEVGDSKESRQCLSRRFQGMCPERFAYFLADLWEEYLHRYTRVIGDPGDRAIDVISTDGRSLQVIRAKQYGPGTVVDASEVREDASLLSNESQVDTMFIVTSGTFSEAAWQAVEASDVILIDVEVLLSLIDDFGANNLLAAYFHDLRDSDRFAAPGSESLSRVRNLVVGGFQRTLGWVLPFETNRYEVKYPR